MKKICAKKVASELANEVRIAIITSRFNEEITQRLFAGAEARLKHYNIPLPQVEAIWVPGAIEITIVAQQLAQRGDLDAIICLGAVIRGETSHYDYVCNQVSEGCAKVSYDYALPVIFGVLTTENKEQALARSGGSHSHIGESAVDSALQMISVLRELRN